MRFFCNFPLFLIVLSLASSVVSSLLKNKAARAVSLSLHALSVILNLIIVLNLGNETVTYMMGHYPHPWGNEIRISPLEAIFSAAFSLILFLTLFGGEKQFADRVPAEKRQFFYVMTDLIQAALLVLAYTNDIFTGYVFIEICTLASCGILMIRQNGKTILASVRYMIFSLIGSGLFLFGVIFLYNITGHLLMPNLKEAIAVLYATGEYHLPLLTSMCLITVGLAVKSGLCPFHLWMADTYGCAIPAASGVHNVLFGLGAAGIIVGSVGAIRENNILRMTAYSSAAQIGYVYMGIGLSPKLGMLAAFYHILTHAFTKSSLFLSAGLLSDCMGGAKKFKYLQGSGFVNPMAGLSFSVSAFSMIGMPFTMGFISKYLFAISAFDSTRFKTIPALLVVAVSTILNTMYFARTILRIYNRETDAVPRETIPLHKEKHFVVSASVFILINITLGIFARPFLSILSEAISVF